MSGNTLPSPETAAASGRQIQLWRWEPHQLKWGWPPILVPLHQTCLVGPWEGIVRSLTDYICHHTARPAWVILKHVWSFIIILCQICMNWSVFMTSVHESSGTLHVAVIIIIQGFPILFSILQLCIVALGEPVGHQKSTRMEQHSSTQLWNSLCRELHHPTQQLHDDGCKTSEPHCQNNYLHQQSVSTSSAKLIF